jgi:hypothetical protein
VVLAANSSDAVGNGRPDPGGNFLKQQFSGFWGHVNNLLGTMGLLKRPPPSLNSRGLENFAGNQQLAATNSSCNYPRKRGDFEGGGLLAEPKPARNGNEEVL